MASNVFIPRSWVWRTVVIDCLNGLLLLLLLLLLLYHPVIFLSLCSIIILHSWILSLSCFSCFNIDYVILCWTYFIFPFS